MITNPVLGAASAFNGGVTITALAGPEKGAREVNRRRYRFISVAKSLYLEREKLNLQGGSTRPHRSLKVKIKPLKNLRG